MCGIAGIWNMRADRAPEPPELRRMVDSMKHRGPDAQGVRTFDGGGFGHARLSILDLSPESNQPFELDGGALLLTYNGEIFNYLDLRAELEALGHAFHTTSDTEVLLHAYKEWGRDAPRRFNGMWAFAIYDRARDELFCSRDRYGIKPF
jgi:asparagine synthase (glutamine-hydrolysing)